MDQLQFNFGDPTPKAGSDGLKNSAKSLIMALQLISISQISTQKYLSALFDDFKMAKIYRPIGGRLRNHSDQPGAVITFLLNSKEKNYF